MTKVAAFLEQHGLTQRGLADQLGFKNANTVGDRARKDLDIPETWYQKLSAAGYHIPEMDSDWAPPVDTDIGQQFRAGESEPRPPEGAPQAKPTYVGIDYGQVSGYIEGVYKLTGEMAIQPYDPLLAECITAHAESAGKAWAKWIESEPKVAALLQRLMVGTPMGEVIGVHFAIVFAYIMGRQAAERIARDHAQRIAEEEAATNGGTGATAEDFVA
jgi:hypothetical protein